MIETIYLARHGFRLSWESNSWTSPTGTPRDPPLSAHGLDQARELATWLASVQHDPVPIRWIISSSVFLPLNCHSVLTLARPLYRCLQTAAPASKALSLPIYVEHGISEWYLPARRGQHPLALSADELREWFPTIAGTLDSQSGGKRALMYPSRKGESKDEVHARALEAVTKLVKALDERSETAEPEAVVIFTHAATNIALARALCDDADMDVRSGCCSVGKYERIRGDGSRNGLGRWKRTMNGNCDFLKNGEERHWDFSFVEEYEEDGILEDGSEGVLVSDQYKL